MSAAAPAQTEPGWTPLLRRNIAILVSGQALLGAQLPMLILLGGLAGASLADNLAFATLPVFFQYLMNMLSAGPASLLMARIGRRGGFLLGAVFGFMGGVLAALALIYGQFWWLCAAHGCAGVFHACLAYFRFAAADMAPPKVRPTAISWVMAGGLIAALIGPEIARISEDIAFLGPYPLAASYAAIALINIVGALPLLGLRIPRPPAPDRNQVKTPLGVILRRPRIAAAMLCAMASYAPMTLIMTSTPLAMQDCGFGVGLAGDVIRWHVIGMFGPSFFTGPLIARFGAPRIIAIGLGLIALCVIVTMAGVQLMNFYAGLILLGLGWNFGFIGATSLLAGAHSPEERARVQGLNDTLVAAMVALASLGSGALLHGLGWRMVSLAAVPMLLCGAAALALFVIHARRGAAPV